MQDLVTGEVSPVGLLLARLSLRFVVCDWWVLEWECNLVVVVQ